MCPPQWLGKILKFIVFKLLENAFVKLFPPLAWPNHKSPYWKAFLREKSPILGGRGRRHYALSSELFPFVKVSSLTFVVQTMAFQANPISHCVFKVTQYGYEIFLTVLSLNCKIMWLKTFNLVINLPLISNKNPNLFSAVGSEINTVSNTSLILL